MNMHIHFSFLPASSPVSFSAFCHSLMNGVGCITWHYADECLTDLSCMHPQAVDKQIDTEIVSHHALNILKAD